MVLKELLCGYSNLSLRYITEWRARQNKAMNNTPFFFRGILCCEYRLLGSVVFMWCFTSKCPACLPDNYGVKLLEGSERAGCALDNLVQSFHIATEGIPTRYMCSLIAVRGWWSRSCASLLPPSKGNEGVVGGYGRRALTLQLSWGFSPWCPFQQLQAPPPVVQLTGTNWPGGGLDRHLHTQECKQLDTGQTNFLFSEAWYYHTDTMALFQIHLGSLSRTNLRPCLQVLCKKDKEMHQPPTRNQTPPHTWVHPISPQDSPWERHRVISSQQPPSLFTPGKCKRLRSPSAFASEISLELMSCSLNTALSGAGVKPSDCTGWGACQREAIKEKRLRLGFLFLRLWRPCVSPFLRNPVEEKPQAFLPLTQHQKHCTRNWESSARTAWIMLPSGLTLIWTVPFPLLTSPSLDAGIAFFGNFIQSD